MIINPFTNFADLRIQESDLATIDPLEIKCLEKVVQPGSANIYAILPYEGDGGIIYATNKFIYILADKSDYTIVVSPVIRKNILCFLYPSGISK